MANRILEEQKERNQDDFELSGIAEISRLAK